MTGEKCLGCLSEQGDLNRALKSEENVKRRGEGILGWKVGLVPTSTEQNKFISRVRGWNLASGVDGVGDVLASSSLGLATFCLSIVSLLHWHFTLALTDTERSLWAVPSLGTQ